MSLSLPSAAQTWTGTTSTDWTLGTNWSGGSAPTTGDVSIRLVVPNPTVLGTAGAATATSRNVFVGSSGGSGNLTIQNGSSLTSSATAYSYVGLNGGSVGVMNVTGPGSTWTINGAPNAVSLLLGSVASGGGRADGTLNISNSGAVQTAGDIVVGETNGTGVLNVTSGGTLTTGRDGYIGRFGGSVGTAAISGAGSTWTIANRLFVGNGGPGTLTISNNATVDVGTSTTVGSSGSQGTLNVTTGGTLQTQTLVRGTGPVQVNFDGGTLRAKASTPSFVTGFSGTELNIAAGGLTIDTAGFNVTASSPFSGTGGLAMIGAGTLTLTGTSNYTGGTSVNGTGTLQLLNGGQITGTSGITVGQLNSAVTLTVSGPGSLIQTTGGLTVGFNTGSNATVNVLGGGVVRTAGAAAIGHLNSQTAVANVDGVGSLLDVGGTLNVGATTPSTIAFLNVTNGGAVRSLGGTVGHFAVGTATKSVLISGAGSSWAVANTLNITGGASIAVLNGGTATAATSTIGSGGTSTLLVSGLGSSYAIAGNVTVGGGAGSGTGAVTLADGGSMTVGGTLSLATAATRTGVLNIGGAEGQAATGAGTLNAATLAFGPGTGRLNFNHTDTGYVFSTSLTGGGAINHNGPGRTIFTSDSSGFTGATTVSNGSLFVNGSLSGSPMAVQSGALLGGSGTVGATTIATGGTIAPGNSIGTLTVNGAYSQAAGATYQVELDPATVSSDLIKVNGTATLAPGAGLSVVNYTGTAYTAGQRYTILTSTGLTGNYGATDIAIGPILSLRKDTDATNAYLTVIQTGTAGGVGGSGNEIQVGNAVDSLPNGNAVQSGVYSQPSIDAARRALNQLSGEIHASAKTALVEESWLLRSAVNDRLRSAFGSVGAATLNYGYTADLAPNAKGPMPLPQTERFAVWGQGYGSWGRSDGDGNAAKLKRSTGGFFLGADAAVFDNWRFGILAGYSRSNFDIDSRLSSGESDNYHLGLYGGGQWGALALRAGASYTWHDVETRRSVTSAFLGSAPRADYDAGTAQIFGEFGYRIDLGRVAFEPFAGLAYVHLDGDGFNETGAATALSVRSDTAGIGYSTLGLRASTDLDVQGIAMKLRGGLAWRHAFGDTDPKTTMVFAGSSAFTIAGLPIARDAALVEAGLDVAIGRGATLGVAYTGQLADDVQDHAFKGVLAVKF